MAKSTTLPPTPVFAYCDLRCERCPLMSSCEVSLATAGDQPLPPTPTAYAALRDRRAAEIEGRLDSLVAEAYLTGRERPDVRHYQAALDRALFDPLAEHARELAQLGIGWLQRRRSAWSCKILAPIREAGLVEAIDVVSLCAPLVADKALRALWLAAVGGRPAQVESPHGQAKAAAVAVEQLMEAWSTIARNLPNTEAEAEFERCEHFLADLTARFPQAADFHRAGLDPRL